MTASVLSITRCSGSPVCSDGAREGAAHWPRTTPGADRRNEALDAIAQNGRREWKKRSGYHRRSLAENLMFRLKTLVGPLPVGAPDRLSGNGGVYPRGRAKHRMVVLVRPKSVSPEIKITGVRSSSRFNISA